MLYCVHCSQKYNSWIGRCKCGSWDLTSEEKNLNIEEETYVSEINLTKFQEIQDVCKFKKPSTIIIAGEPGTGKSTLMCQIASNIEGQCLYLAGEEAVSNVRQRFHRVAPEALNVVIKSFCHMEKLEPLLMKYKPDLIILDSIHTTRYDEEENSKNIMFFLLQLTKKYNFCALIISHITKEGLIAGPKTLEHAVDIVMYLEGDRYGSMRLLRSIKNRFGPTDELVVLEMTSSGFIPISNPSSMFLANKNNHCSGSVIFAGMAGSRPFLTEIQALVVQSTLPAIEAIGLDIKRLRMILAILNKWCGLKLFNKDIFVNCVGGLKINDPAVDLAVAIAIISSYKNKIIESSCCFFGELGLTGEIRSASFERNRIKETKKMGINTIFANSNELEKSINHLHNDLIKQLFN